MIIQLIGNTRARSSRIVANPRTEERVLTEAAVYHYTLCCGLWCIDLRRSNVFGLVCGVRVLYTCDVVACPSCGGMIRIPRPPCSLHVLPVLQYTH